MDRLEIRKQIQDVADELYESIPNGPLKYIVGDIMANNEEYVLNNFDTVGTEYILHQGFTVNQLKWITELKEMNELLDKMVRFPTIHKLTMK